MFGWRWNREDGKKGEKNGWEKCLVGRGRGRKFWWGPWVFSRAHQNTISPNRGENVRENCANIFDKNAHAKSHCVSAAALCFLFFLNFFSNPLCTCCCPLFPILFLNFLTGRGWAFVSNCSAASFFYYFYFYKFYLQFILFFLLNWAFFYFLFFLTRHDWFFGLVEFFLLLFFFA